MDTEIGYALKDIELEKDVEVLYACESGSRCWGIHSVDSDYDIRFIYRRPPRHYMKLNSGKDTIHRTKEIGNLDLEGWDVKKALTLFRKSNPPLLEWLRSRIVYRKKLPFYDSLVALIPVYYSRKAASYHYYHMAKGNYRDYLQGEMVQTKKYFYVLRPLLSVRWIANNDSMPPLDFYDLVAASDIPGELKYGITALLDMKTGGNELGVNPRSQMLNDFIEEVLEHLGAIPFDQDCMNKDFGPANELFITTVFVEPMARNIVNVMGDKFDLF